MPGTYKLFTAIVALIGNVSLILTGEMTPLFSIIGTGLLWGYFRSMKGYASLPKGVVGILSLSTFIVFVANSYISGDIYLSVAHMTLIFQTLKSFDIKEPWDPLQVFFVSLLQLLMASELTNSLSFGVVFLVFLVFIVVSMVLGHFVKEEQKIFGPFLGPVAFITVFSLVLTVIFFISIPRLQRGLWGKSFLKGIKTTGFSEKVDFGSFGTVKLDETVVMRVIIRPDPYEPVYLRGMTFDYFDNTAWYDTLRERSGLYRTSGGFSEEVPGDYRTFESEIYLEPIDSDIVFTIMKPHKIYSTGYYLRRDSAGSFFMKQKISKRFFYRMFSHDGYYHDNSHMKSYLQLPEMVHSVRGLAESVTAGATGPEDKARAIENYLLTNYAYSLENSVPDKGFTAIENFVFNSKKGYCEHFATTMTLMLRSVGIPARLVTGYLGGRKNEFGDYYLVRQSDAHSWVEAYTGDRWKTHDPTPALESPVRQSLLLLLDTINLNWYRYVVGFSTYDQIRMTHYLLGYRRSLMSLPEAPIMRFVIAVLFLLGIFYVLKKKLRKPAPVRYEGVPAEYWRFRKKVSLYGGRILPSSSTDDVLKEAIGTGVFDPDAVRTFIHCYRFLRFSGRTDKEVLNDFHLSSDRLKKRSRDKGK
jgi:transglutaminase-like putative cysteine protease